MASEKDVQMLIGEGSLSINGADIYADGSVGLVPVFPRYAFCDDTCTTDAITTIFLGDGRATLACLRDTHADIPVMMQPKDFLVTGVDVHTRDHHVVLRREVLTDGIHAKVVHGESCILQAGRTRGGARQLELWNANGTPQEMAKLRIVADLYKAAEIAEPGH